mgnify:CR=1 FL=1
MESYKKLRAELLRNKEFRKAYDALGPEFELIAMIIDKRIKNGLTQAALARKVGNKHSAIARLESGGYNPSMAFLEKVAKALGGRLSISIS